MPIDIAIANTQRRIPIRRGVLRSAVHAVLTGEGVSDAAISVAIVDDATSHRVNRQYLRHDEPTDVITFPLNERGKSLAAELVINADRAAAEARSRRLPVDRELALYVIHGLLHLCGYDDRRPDDVRVMRRRERHYLRQL
jgi:probable rRNA maturation factor